MKKIHQRLFEVGLFSVTAGVLILAGSLYLLKDSPFQSLVNILAIFVGIFPLVAIQTSHYVKMKSIEENFPLFLADIAENVKAGMTLVKSIKILKGKNYGRLTPYVRKIINRIDWGVSFEDVMNSFAEEIENTVITRSVKTLIETHRYGGKIEDVLTAVVKSTMIMENIKKEREARIFSQIINGYVIYVLFLGIMVIMSRFLIPVMASTTEGKMMDPEFFTGMFKVLIVIQSIFSGLILGKMSEGVVSAGFKHVFIMLLLGYLTMLLF